MAMMLATSAADTAHMLITISSRQPSRTIHLAKDSEAVGITFSSDDGGREEVVSETWTPMAEAMMKGIFTEDSRSQAIYLIHRSGGDVHFCVNGPQVELVSPTNSP